jgi:hypothetical protein
MCISVASGSVGNIRWELCEGGTLTINGNGSIPNYSGTGAPWYTHRTSIVRVVIGNGITTVGSYAFAYLTEMKEVSLPGSLTSIGNYTFMGSGLTSVIIPASVSSIGTYVFSSCGALTEIRVDAANSFFTSEDDVLFNKQKNMLIAYPSGRTGNYDVPYGVSQIGWGAFGGSALTSVTMPTTLTTIDGWAFWNCVRLETVYIPASVSVINTNAFSYCNRLTTITNRSTAPQSVAADVFTYVNTAACTLHVPSASENAYKVAAVWKDFIVDGVAMPEVTSITVMPAQAIVNRGQNLQLTANVTATDGASDAVSWSVSGSRSTISTTGLLAVAADEPSVSLIVTATSVFDPSKKSTAWIIVEAAPSVQSVTVTPSTATVQKGNTQRFMATVVVQGGASQSVIWSVSSIRSAIDETGLLTVAADETDATLIVTATSTEDGTKKGTADITVKEEAVTRTPELDAPSLELYPNPFADHVRIAGAEGCTLQIITVTGTVVYIQNIDSHNVTIPLEHLSEGVYFFCIEKDRRAKTIKLIKYK